MSVPRAVHCVGVSAAHAGWLGAAVEAIKDHIIANPYLSSRCLFCLGAPTLLPGRSAKSTVFVCFVHRIAVWESTQRSHHTD